MNGAILITWLVRECGTEKMSNKKYSYATCETCTG
jgi:hypothetical protein